MNDLTSSDWVLIGSTLFLGAVAIFGPAFADLFKRRFLAPNLQIRYSHSPPGSHKTKWGSYYDVYFFRFLITNDGKSIARNCQVLIEELWIYDVSGKAHNFTNFSPVNLRFDESGTKFIDISSNDRPIFWNIGQVSERKYQELDNWMKPYIDIPGEENNKGLRFMIETLHIPFSQPNSLVPGKYAIKVSVYPENTPKASTYFSISWSGKWKEREEEMFREIVISQSDKP